MPFCNPHMNIYTDAYSSVERFLWVDVEIFQVALEGVQFIVVRVVPRSRSKPMGTLKVKPNLINAP